MTRRFCLILACLLGFSQLALGGSFLNDYDAIEEACDAVFYLEVYDQEDERIAEGSAFLAFDDSTLVSNYHVIEGWHRIKVYDEDMVPYAFQEVLGTDTKSDLAILRLAEPTGLVPLRLAEDPEILRGLPVAAIGSPLGYINSFSTGIISGYSNLRGLLRIQFTAPVSNGSSGGALLNAEGEVIGIPYLIVLGGQNLNLAVHIKHAQELYQDIGQARALGSAADAAKMFPLGMLDRGVAVLRLQSRLIELGYLSGPPDSIYGTATFYAVMDFQRAVGLEQTGEADAVMQALLYEFSDGDPVPTVPPIPFKLMEPPGNLRAFAEHGEVRLTWQPIEGADMYWIYRADAPGRDPVLYATSRRSSYTDTRVEAGREYSYFVIALAGLRFSENSESVSVTP